MNDAASARSTQPCPEIRAVFMDVDQTLLDFDACAASALQEAFAQSGLEWNGTYYDRFLRMNARLWDRVEEGSMSREELQKTRFPILFEAWNLSVEEPEAFERVFSSVLHESVFLMPWVLEGLQVLKKRNLPLFIISNGPARGQKRRLKQAGILDFFEEVYTSEDFRAEKPDPVFFQKALASCRKHLGQPVDFQEILVIGDSYKADILGALGCGMPAVWLRANRRYDPFEVRPEPGVIFADSWREIIALFETAADREWKDE